MDIGLAICNCNTRLEPILLLSISIGYNIWGELHNCLHPSWLSHKYRQLVPQLLSFPLGILWASCVPNISIRGVELNPGPFNIKEHVLITIMGSVGAVSA